MLELRQVPTARRPQVPKISLPADIEHHKFEDYLASPFMQEFLRLLTRRNSRGRCYLEEVFESYDKADPTFWERVKFAVPHHLIEVFRRKGGVNKEVLKAKVFHHRPTVRALVNTARSIAKYGLTVPQRFSAPLIVVWNYTQACNLTCKHCYQEAGHKPLADELTTEQKLDLVDQMADEYVPFVAFAGGEPLVTKDIWKVLEHAKKRGVHTTVATNGTLLSKEVCQRLVECGVKYVEVSLDSVVPEEHDRFRGLPGAWKRTVDGMRNVASTPGLRCGMAACLTQMNFHHANAMIELAKDLGCTTFVHFNFIPVGRARELAHLDITPEQREQLIQLLNRHLQEGKISIMSTAPQFGRACILYGPLEGYMATAHAGKGKGKQAKVLSKYIGGCGAGRCYCSVEPNGKVTPCVYMASIEVGDLKRQKLLDAWDNPLFAVLSDRQDRSDHCGVCDFRAYCGGCRARALSYVDDIRAGDPGCIYNRHVWDEVVASAQRESELVVLGQHSPVDSLLAGASDGAVSVETSEQLVHDSLAAIADAFPPPGQAH
jgi:radical SAM protein with 4Fe4S-binding SPASM domain